jgi:hypothetical protein
MRWVAHHELILSPAELDYYFYVATPYSKYPKALGGIAGAYRDACIATSILVEQGVRAYSPIVHTHPIAIEGNMDPYDHSIWMPQDEPFMRNASGLVVVMMDGWKQSTGVTEEVKYFEATGKPVFYMAWEHMDRGALYAKP